MKSCHRYIELFNESRDRNLTEDERSFMAVHKSMCDACATLEHSAETALNLLSECVFEIEDSPTDDRRIVRHVKIDSARRSFKFWSPALVGLAIGLIIMLSTLQLLSAPDKVDTVKPFGEAKRVKDKLPTIPDEITTIR